MRRIRMSKPKPFWVSDDGMHTVYCGDSRSILPTLDVVVDLVATDPPYGNNYKTGMRDKRNKRVDTHDQLFSTIAGDDAVDTWPLITEVSGAVDRLLSENAAMYWFAAPNQLHNVMPILANRWEIVNVLSWDKCNFTAGDLECAYGRQWEAIIYTRKGRCKLAGKREGDVIRISKGNTSAYVHPTQKPITLMQRLLMKHDCSVVLDPFLGGGTTGVAAAKLGRRFIGIELSEEFCRIAVKRIEKAKQSIFNIHKTKTRELFK